MINTVHLREHLEFTIPKMGSVSNSRKILDFRQTDTETIWNEMRKMQQHLKHLYWKVKRYLKELSNPYLEGTEIVVAYQRIHREY